MKNTTARTVRLALAAGAATFALTLAGCGGLTQDKEPVEAPVIENEEIEQADEEPTEIETVEEEAGPGVYQAEMYEGAVATAAVPGEAPEDIEQFRKDTDQDPVGYLVVEVDNTDGTDEAMLFEARVVDKDGKTYKYEEITQSTYDWTDGHDDQLSRQMELWDEYPYSVDPTAKTTVPLIGPEVPEDIISVFIDDQRAERVGDL